MVDGLVRNLIADGLADHRGDSDTIFELEVGSNSTLKPTYKARIVST
jgi:hypothetical protein